jgi:sugar O-acyltransferase (sialic acid O-acetyltransferase NeuD family)
MKKALIGGGGHAREVESMVGFSLIKFVDDEFYNGERFTKKLSDFNPYEFEVMIAVGNPKDRYRIYEKLPKETKFFTFIHPTSIITKNTIIKEGTFIGPYCIITTNVSLGSHLILNRSNQIGHDSVVGNFVSLMPGSIVSGNVNIGDRVYLGTNSSVKEKIKITSDVTVGLNSGVVKDINNSGVYIGTPSTKIK